MAIQLKRYTADYRASAATSNSKRWESEFANETWAIDPLDMLTLAEFEKLLRSKFGARYFEQVDFEWRNGQFVPAQTPERVVRSLFRHHPEGLTRLEVKRYTGLNNGKVAAIVCPPTYKAIAQRVDRQFTSQVWAPEGSNDGNA